MRVKLPITVNSSMEIADGIVNTYAFVVSWIEVSRGVFFSEGMPNLQECMAYLNTFSYDAMQVKLECIQVYPEQ